MAANAGDRSEPVRTMTGPDAAAIGRSAKMRKNRLRTRMTRTLMAFAIGGSAFQVSGCDPALRSTLLGGLEATAASLSTALISAFFLSLEDDDGAGTGLTTT